MRKTLSLLAVLFVVCLAATAQPQAYDSKVDYQKTRQFASAIDLPYNTDIVEDGIKNYLSGKGLKGNSTKGYTVYRGARMSDSATDLNDLWFKVGRRSGDKKSSVVTLLVVKPSEDPATRAEGAAGPQDKGRSFLNSLVPPVEAHSLEVEITGEEAVLKKANKKLSNLLDDQTDLEKKIRNTQADLDQDKKDQILQTNAVQANVNGNQDDLKKAQKKLNKLMDDQSSMEKKIRKYQSDLDENKRDQTGAQAEVQRQQQMLDSMKARRK
jgi:hypothetical protein